MRLLPLSAGCADSGGDNAGDRSAFI